MSVSRNVSYDGILNSHLLPHSLLDVSVSPYFPTISAGMYTKGLGPRRGIQAYLNTRGNSNSPQETGHQQQLPDIRETESDQTAGTFTLALSSAKEEKSEGSLVVSPDDVTVDRSCEAADPEAVDVKRKLDFEAGDMLEVPLRSYLRGDIGTSQSDLTVLEGSSPYCDRESTQALIAKLRQLTVSSVYMGGPLAELCRY